MHSTVYYFGTCLGDLIYPQEILAGFKLLKKAGLKVEFPLQQSCCGQAAYNAGYPKEAKKVALAQLVTFSKNNWPVIVPSGSCAAMMKIHYPNIFKDSPYAKKALDLSKRVFELGEFLYDVLKVKYEDKGEPIKISWHSSCHSLREMKCSQADKNLIKSLKNVTLIELEHEDQCCGFGGIFSVKQASISAKMVKDKIDDIVASKTQTLVSADCACLMNISGAMAKKNLNFETRYLAEFIWQRITRD